MQRLNRRVPGALLLALAMALPVQAASPSLGGINPRGVQRGVENQMVFSGGRLQDAKEIFFYSPGFEVIKLEAAAGQVKATVKVLPNCRLGQHVAQVRTASGVSEYKTFWVGPFASTPEKEPNSDFAAPQPVPLNITVTGVVNSEDVDYYVVEAKKGQRIAAEVEGMRLATTLFDPYVASLTPSDSSWPVLMTRHWSSRMRWSRLWLPPTGVTSSRSVRPPMVATAVADIAFTLGSSRVQPPFIRPVARWGRRSK